MELPSTSNHDVKIKINVIFENKVWDLNYFSSMLSASSLIKLSNCIYYELKHYYTSVMEKKPPRGCIIYNMESNKETRAECTVLISDDETLTELNKKFRNKDGPTNVLSFPTEPTIQKFSVDRSSSDYIYEDRLYIGDIAISCDTIFRESKQYHQKFDDRFMHIMVHGVLHLLGFDHIIEEDWDLMSTLEIAILKVMGINNPYVYNITD